jgi:hypothetical protein
VLAAVDTVEVIAVDPSRGRIRWRQYLLDQSEAVARTEHGFVFLISSYAVHPGDQIGPTTLATVDANRVVRSVLLDRVLSGEYQDEQDQSHFIDRQPGLAVDRAANRAYVVGAGEPVAEVDLTTLAVTYHGGSRTLAKTVDGPVREAYWLDNGRIAMTGYDSRSWKDASGQEQEAEAPAGLTLIDPHDWTSRLIDSDATQVAVAGDVVLASESLHDSESAQPQGRGVTAYDLEGNRRFHLFDGPVGVRVAGGTAYVSEGSQIAVVDLASRSVLNTVTPTNDLSLLTPEP